MTSDPKPLESRSDEPSPDRAAAAQDDGSRVTNWPELATRSGGGCELVDLPRITDPRGNLTFVESDRHIPFPISRVFYLYDVPGGAVRAGHALKTCHQFLVAMSGSFDVLVDNGTEQARYRLDRSYYGLHIPPLVWRELENFSSGSVCLALASEVYDESGYYRNYSDFVEAITSGSP